MNSKISRRGISFLKRFRSEPEEVVDQELVDNLETQSIWEALSDEEIMKIRDRSNFSALDRQKYYSTCEKPVKFGEMYQYHTDYVREFYAKYGKSSGLRAGVCWPRKQELAFLKQYEKEFYPSLEQLMKQNEKEKQALLKEKEAREKEIASKLKHLEKYKKEFFEKLAEKSKTEEEEKLRLQKQIQDVREFLGYSIDPKDPRFEEALAKKEEQERAQIKTASKKNKHAKLFEELQLLIDSANDKKDDKQSNDSKEVPEPPADKKD